MLKTIKIVFFFSGFSAILYQIVWQRLLYSAIGINIEAVTIIVSVFMFGLGVGALFGGYLSKVFNYKLLLLFVFIEYTIGIFGLLSIPFINFITEVTLSLPDWILPIVIYSVFIIPTTAMGATLPILVTYYFKKTKSIQHSVSDLYFINTLGAAFACLMINWVFFVFFSLSISIFIAAFINFSIASTILISQRLIYND